MEIFLKFVNFLPFRKIVANTWNKERNMLDFDLREGYMLHINKLETTTSA